MCFSSDWPSTLSLQRPTPRLSGDAAVVEIGRTFGCQNETYRSAPNPTFAPHLRITTAPHKQAQLAKLGHASNRAFENVGCARQQP